MSGQAGPTDLRATGGLKWTYYDEDVLAAWVAEMDYGLAPSISEALQDAVERADTAYPYPDLMDLTAGSAVSFWEDWLGWEVDAAWVFAVPDVIEGIRRAIVHLTRPDSPVILHTPVYFPFFSMVERAGREMVEVPCGPGGDGRYTIDVEAVDRAFANGAGSLVLCNPWNPTGRCLSELEIAELVEVAASHQARVIVDEIHAPITFSPSRHRAAAGLNPDVVVTVTSASKAWNLPGLKCAQVVLTNGDDRSVWETYFPQVAVDRIGVSTFGLVANAAAYSGGREWLGQVMTRLESNRKLLGEILESLLPDVGYFRSESTYLAWLDFSSYGLSEPAEHLLENANVALTEGGPFGTGGEGRARLNFATHEPILIEVVERMATALNR